MDPERTSALGQFPTPTTHTDLRSFLGLVNQFGDFSDEIAKLTQPLRSLLKANAEFLWNQDHDAAMLNIKSSLLRIPTLAYYEFGAPTRLETDVSRNNGLGYALLPLQGGNWRLIKCGSRFISDTESRYAMIEFELLAIAWAMKKCHVYLSGTKFEVITDHQPLISIMNKYRYSLMEIENPRIRRMLIKLQGYQYLVSWRKGKDHAIADALSRSPIGQPTKEDTAIGELPYEDCGRVASVTSNLLPSVATISSLFSQAAKQRSSREQHGPTMPTNSSLELSSGGSQTQRTRCRNASSRIGP